MPKDQRGLCCAGAGRGALATRLGKLLLRGRVRDGISRVAISRMHGRAFGQDALLQGLRWPGWGQGRDEPGQRFQPGGPAMVPVIIEVPRMSGACGVLSKRDAGMDPQADRGETLVDVLPVHAARQRADGCQRPSQTSEFNLCGNARPSPSGRVALPGR